MEGADIRVTGQAYHDVYDLLWELIKNAAEHGNQEQDITVRARLTGGYASNSKGITVDAIELSIASHLARRKDAEKLAGVFLPIELSEAEKQKAATEGASGVLKVRAILDRQNKTHDVASTDKGMHYEVDGDVLTVSVFYPILAKT